jgi:hypothetical protein
MEPSLFEERRQRNINGWGKGNESCICHIGCPPDNSTHAVTSEHRAGNLLNASAFAALSCSLTLHLPDSSHKG